MSLYGNFYGKNHLKMCNIIIFNKTFTYLLGSYVKKPKCNIPTSKLRYLKKILLKDQVKRS
jgi:hypothetical protein